MQLKRKQLISTSFILVAALGFFLLRGSTTNKTTTVQAMKQTSKGPLLVNTALLTVSPIEEKIFATGTLMANEEIDLRNEVAGRVSAINFREGSNVRQGDLLVKINDADLRATLRKLELQQALAEKEEARAKKLLEQNLLSVEEYDAKMSALEVVQADIDKTKSDIAKTEIRAPFSGTVGLRSISNGSTITAATSIAHLQQISPIKIEFSVPEKYASRIRPGSQITFTTVGNDHEFTGSVYAIEPKIDLATRTLKVRAVAPNPSGELRPGAFAKIRITLQHIDDALSVPSASVVPMLDGQKVYVMQNGKAVSKTVTIGIRTDSTIQITGGLASGDTVITTGVMQLREGAPVATASRR